jgi:hypothetical protein
MSGPAQPSMIVDVYIFLLSFTWVYSDLRMYAIWDASAISAPYFAVFKITIMMKSS